MILGSGWIYIGLEERKAEVVGQSGMRNERERSEPIGSLKAGDGGGEGLGRELEKEGIGPFQGQMEGINDLGESCFPSFKSQVRGFLNLLREKPSFLFMLLGWSSISNTFLMIWSLCLNFLAYLETPYWLGPFPLIPHL
jgi:hypothetical protein